MLQALPGFGQIVPASGVLWPTWATFRSEQGGSSNFVRFWMIWPRFSQHGRQIWPGFGQHSIISAEIGPQRLRQKTGRFGLFLRGIHSLFSISADFGPRLARPNFVVQIVLLSDDFCPTWAQFRRERSVVATMPSWIFEVQHMGNSPKSQKPTTPS